MQIDAGKMVLILEKAVDILNISIPWIPVLFIPSFIPSSFILSFNIKSPYLDNYNN